jgi:hypothetical protein
MEPEICQELWGMRLLRILLGIGGLQIRRLRLP